MFKQCGLLGRERSGGIGKLASGQVEEPVELRHLERGTAHEKVAALLANQLPLVGPLNRVTLEMRPVTFIRLAKSRAASANNVVSRKLANVPLILA